MHKATVANFEIGARDSESLKRFYASLFGWRISREVGSANVAHCIEPGSPGITTFISEGHSGVIPFVEVDDVFENLCYAEELGGRIIELPHEIVSGGLCVMVALFADPEGNHLGLSRGWQKLVSAREQPAC